MGLAFPLVPDCGDRNESLYFVLCDYGPKIGRAHVDTDPDEADRETVMAALISGEYSNPVKILAVDTDVGGLRDATAEIVEEIARRLQTLQSKLVASVSKNMEFQAPAARSRLAICTARTGSHAAFRSMISPSAMS